MAGVVGQWAGAGHARAPAVAMYVARGVRPPQPQSTVWAAHGSTGGTHTTHHATETGKRGAVIWISVYGLKKGLQCNTPHHRAPMQYTTPLGSNAIHHITETGELGAVIWILLSLYRDIDSISGIQPHP